jgi:hypothetical protein
MLVTRQGADLTVRVTGVKYSCVTPIEAEGQTLWQVKVGQDRGNEGHGAS